MILSSQPMSVSGIVSLWVQMTGDVERSDVSYEGEESFEGELSEAVSQDRDRDVNDDLIIVGQLYTAL